MFTGLIETVAHIVDRSVRSDGQGVHFRIQSGIAHTLQVGDSVALQGVCLTIEACQPPSFIVTAVPLTLQRTTVGTWQAGMAVNLERALAANGRLGGHFVQGHVDGIGHLQADRQGSSGRILTVQAPADLLPYIAPRGSIAIDGVSLTVALRTAQGFEVAIIPHTAAMTTLGTLHPGDALNLETDVLAKYVEQLLHGHREE